MQKAIVIVMIVFLVLGIPYGIYKLKRWWNYSVGGYETSVTKTMCEKLSPEAFVDYEKTCN